MHLQAPTQWIDRASRRILSTSSFTISTTEQHYQSLAREKSDDPPRRYAYEKKAKKKSTRNTSKRARSTSDSCTYSVRQQIRTTVTHGYTVSKHAAFVSQNGCCRLLGSRWRSWKHGCPNACRWPCNLRRRGDLSRTYSPKYTSTCLYVVVVCSANRQFTYTEVEVVSTFYMQPPPSLPV